MKQQKDVLIISAAPQENIEYIKQIYDETHPYVICVDGGIEKTHRLGLHTDILIGDMDSSGGEFDGDVVRLPVCKDFSDTEVALNHAIDIGATNIMLTGVTGGRIDHSLCNLYLLFSVPKEVNIAILDDKNMVYAAKSGVIKGTDSYKYISIIPIDEMLTGVCINGVKYPLCDAVLYRTKSVGLSNEVTGNLVEFSSKNGRAFIIFSRD